MTSCRTATEAVDIGLDHDWDPAIVDISMPYLSGLDLAAAWREAGASFPVMVFSGHDVPLTGLPAGVAAWVTKPFIPAELRVDVERLTGRAMTRWWRNLSHDQLPPRAPGLPATLPDNQAVNSEAPTRVS